MDGYMLEQPPHLAGFLAGVDLKLGIPDAARVAKLLIAKGCADI